MKRSLLAGFVILIAWMLLDILGHLHSHADSGCRGRGLVVAGWLKGVVAGAIVGAVIVES